ncbi:MAG: beta-ketoacyl-[acyl-carrier-protein] synthase family protein [Proteobacteria bacterium]|nr:beta-ketoacyl-[acyl-carrier-protein] synthase family protein [Pseudomonadota bacterium]MCP4917937.1 beta-ketoacyl-[acyl-carrier-protein] synthase family protein [Pseudomonadota bacterium]
MRRRVVVTGIGMVTPLGPDVESTWSALCEGQSGIGPIERFDPTGFPVRFAAEVDVSSADDEGQLKLDLTERALAEALAMAGPIASSPARIGVCMGSEAARPSLGVIGRRYRLAQVPERGEIERAAPQAPSKYVAERVGAMGPTTTISTACTSSSQAVGEGGLRIRRGEVDVMVVGGADLLVNPVMVTGFSLLGALSTRNEDPSAASRPFDKHRDGFVLGEGAGVLVLEELESARARGATILGEITGFGCSCNAYRITDSPPDGRGAAQAMELAIADAGLAPEDIGYVNAHGTSTPMNDVSESRGVRKVFGDHAVPVSSTKSMMGHLVAACGAVEAIVSLLAVRDGVLPPTINLDTPDPECRVEHIPFVAREARIQHALTNAFGFGGSNGSLVVSRFA